MKEFQAGDRVVKMSGVAAGKYGTVNSVLDNGTLNVTFDGERRPRYCDPERCGQVATNAKIVTQDNFGTLRVGDHVDFRKSRYWKGTGVVTRVYGDGIIDVKGDRGEGEMEIHEEDILNSRAANADASSIARDVSRKIDKYRADCREMARTIRSVVGTDRSKASEVSHLMPKIKALYKDGAIDEITRAFAPVEMEPGVTDIRLSMENGAREARKELWGALKDAGLERAARNAVARNNVGDCFSDATAWLEDAYKAASNPSKARTMIARARQDVGGPYGVLSYDGVDAKAKRHLSATLAAIDKAASNPTPENIMAARWESEKGRAHADGGSPRRAFWS